MSLLGALTPLGKVAGGSKLWLRCVIAHTAAGCVSTMLVGALLAEMGRWLGSQATGGIAFYFIGFLSLVLAAREWGWINFRIPQSNRQTEKFWAHEFGFVAASAMWGFHIGLGLATSVTYGGLWVLVAVILVLAEPVYGSMLMLAYWLGRALPVWVAPKLLLPGWDPMQLPEQFRRVDSRIAG